MAVITRDFTVELERRIRQRTNVIQVVLGPRQVGKTTGVLQLEAAGIGPMTYASADLPAPPTYEWISEQWQLARSRGGVLALDEVQKITGWSEVVKRLYDEERRAAQPLQVVLLGSASWLVQSGLTETLAGRFELVRVYHWSPIECRNAFGWNLDTYLQFGGYPAPAPLITEPNRWSTYIRDSIIEPMIARDLLGLRQIAKPALFRQTLELAMHYPAQELSLQKMLGQLQDFGNSTTLKGYLELLESGLILRALAKFSTKPLVRKSSSPKLLPMCPALMHAFQDP